MNHNLSNKARSKRRFLKYTLGGGIGLALAGCTGSPELVIPQPAIAPNLKERSVDEVVKSDAIPRVEVSAISFTPESYVAKGPVRTLKLGPEDPFVLDTNVDKVSIVLPTEMTVPENAELFWYDGEDRHPVRYSLKDGMLAMLASELGGSSGFMSGTLVLTNSDKEPMMEVETSAHHLLHRDVLLSYLGNPNLPALSGIWSPKDGSDHINRFENQNGVRFQLGKYAHQLADRGQWGAIWADAVPRNRIMIFQVGRNTWDGTKVVGLNPMEMVYDTGSDYVLTDEWKRRLTTVVSRISRHMRSNNRGLPFLASFMNEENGGAGYPGVWQGLYLTQWQKFTDALYSFLATLKGKDMILVADFTGVNGIDTVTGERKTPLNMLGPVAKSSIDIVSMHAYPPEPPGTFSAIYNDHAAQFRDSGLTWAWLEIGPKAGRLDLANGLLQVPRGVRATVPFAMNTEGYNFAEIAPHYAQIFKSGAGPGQIYLS